MGQSTVAVLATARDGFSLAAALALRDAGALVTVLVRRGREARFVEAGLPIHAFSGRITWHNLPLLATLRRIGATRIAIVVGDQFAHANVTTALNWWRAAGLLRGGDIYLSRSTQPAVLEGFNTIDEREGLVVAAVAIAGLALLVRHPVVTLTAAGVVAGLEIAARTVGAPGEGLTVSQAPPWPILVDDPRLGWKLRPVNLRATLTTPDAPPQTMRVTVDTEGQRATGGPDEGNLRPVVAFYGGSYVFGDAASDEATIPWRAAALLPQHQVVNRGVPGYGALQALTRLLDDFTDSPPAAAVLIVDGRDVTHLPPAGHARFAPADSLAMCGLIRRGLNRRRAARMLARALRALSERSATLRIPVVVQIAGPDRIALGVGLARHGLRWTDLAANSSPGQTAELAAREVALAFGEGPRA